MKKALLLCMLLALPVLAGAETWAAFVERAGAAMAARTPQEEWVTIEGAGQVEACRVSWDEEAREWTPLDPPLTVPEGDLLVVRGGTFRGMFLGNGQFELEDVTVECGGEGPAAIWLDKPEASLYISLVLGPGTRVRSLNPRADAIASMRREARDAQSFYTWVLILNEGVVELQDEEESEEACAIDLYYENTEEDTISLMILNRGEISPYVRIYAETRGVAEAVIENTGRIEGRYGGSLVEAAGGERAFAMLHNSADAVIAIESQEDADFSRATVALAANQHVETGEEAESRIVIVNGGSIRGDCPLYLAEPLSPASGLEWEDGGVLLSGGSTEVDMELIQQVRDGQEPLDEAAFEAAVRAWLRERIPALPPETRFRVQAAWDYFQGTAFVDSEHAAEEILFTWGEVAGE